MVGTIKDIAKATGVSIATVSMSNQRIRWIQSRS